MTPEYLLYEYLNTKSRSESKDLRTRSVFPIWTIHEPSFRFISIHEMIRDTRSEAPIWIMIRKHWSIIDNIYIQVHLRKLEYGEKVGE